MTIEHLWPLLQVVLVDLMLAADNAIVIGLAAARAPRAMRKRVIFFGIAAAAVLRIAFALLTVQLLQVIGLVLAGGLLLLWVSKANSDNTESKPTEKSVGQAIFQIVLADVSMSLDNVLAVAGIAREHPGILVFGLALSVALMAFGAVYIARLLEKYHWIAYIGLLVILQVSLVMIWEGSQQVLQIALA